MLRSMLVMLMRMNMVAMGQMRVMRGLLVITSLMRLVRLMVVMSGRLMMLGGMMMMVMMLGHWTPPFCLDTRLTLRPLCLGSQEM